MGFGVDGQFFAIEALRELRFPVEQDGCSPNASSVTAVHRRQTNPANVRQRRLRCLRPRVPMMKPAEARVGAKFARAIRFLLDQPGARRLLTQTDVGSVVMIGSLPADRAHGRKCCPDHESQTGTGTDVLPAPKIRGERHRLRPRSPIDRVRRSGGCQERLVPGLPQRDLYTRGVSAQPVRRD